METCCGSCCGDLLFVYIQEISRYGVGVKIVRNCLVLFLVFFLVLDCYFSEIDSFACVGDSCPVVGFIL